VAAPLRAGPFTMLYENGDLRYVSLGEREVIRRIYVAVRDRDWGTVPPRLTDELVEVGEDSFRISYHVRNLRGGIDFRWRAKILGQPDGTIAFEMHGRAHSTFLRNRIGFCVLHPIRECAGTRCRVGRADGTFADDTFPVLIAPDAPFREMTGIAHEVVPGVWAQLKFEGDLFEMEDQRNWLDASFKSFCTPLRLPFPVEIAEGTMLHQSVTLTLSGQSARSRPCRSALTFEVSTDEASPLPSIGLAMASHGEFLTSREVQRLRRLSPAHLRADLHLASGDFGETLSRAKSEAGALAVPLELAIFITDDAESELARLVEVLEEVRPRVCRWLVFHESEWSRAARWIKRARRALGPCGAAAPIVSGTNANFAELNRGRPPFGLLDGICFAAHPQEHACDDRSLVETLPMLEEAAASAREFCKGLPISITPITLRRRVNPYATGPAPGLVPGELPARIDPRQMSLFGAGWTLGSLRYAATGGVASVTYYETTGWLGVMETERGSPLPDRFPSIPGAVFPLYHVLADVGEFAGGCAASSISSDPLRLDGIALCKGCASRRVIANMTEQPQEVAITKLGDRVRIKLLDETNAERAMTSPDEYRAERGEMVRSEGGRLTLRLLPFAIARVDSG
jgi:hypothetical protein